MVVYITGDAAIQAVQLSAWHAKDPKRYPALAVAPPGTPATLTVHFQPNHEIVRKYGARFNGLSVTDRRTKGHTTIAINRENWDSPPPAYGADLPPAERREHYRHYLVNHEVGHFYGHDHAARPRDPTEPCPTMLQQTRYSGPGICATPASFLVGGGDPPTGAAGATGEPLRLPRDTLMADAQASLAFEVLRRRYEEMYNPRRPGERA